MTPERWQKVDEVLQDALDREPAERAAFLRKACFGDEELQRETSSLIEAYDKAGDFIEEPAIARDAMVLISDHAQRIGGEIGPYQIIERIDGGGMSDIYLARDPRLDRLVVLKILPAYFVSDDERLRRFQIEARAASALNHTNVVTIYEVGHAADIHFIAAEFIDGPTIRERIKAEDLSLGEVFEVAAQMMCGLTAAHTAGIVHRDIKPENVMQRRDGVVKILDFGIAKLLEPSSDASESTMRTQTEVGTLLGTIAYMSPEQMRGLSVDPRTDIWSCGVVLYEMLAQQRPFDGQTRADTVVAILQREPPPLFGVEPHPDRLLRQIQAVVSKALRKEPGERYQTAADVLADLEKIKQELEHSQLCANQIVPQTNVKELQGLKLRANASRRRHQIWIAIVSVVLFAAIVTAVFLSRHFKSSPTTSAASKPYLQMSEAEQIAFVAAQEQRISNMMGDRPAKLNDDAIRTIKRHIDRYAARQNPDKLKPGEESLRTEYARAVPQIPVIAQAFAARRIPIVIGLYLPMVESAYQPCYENEIGAKGLFQFLPATAEQYGVARADMCDVQKMAPAAAHYIANRMAELGDDSQSMTLVLLSYNRGPDDVRELLRRLREVDANYERNFWTLFANRAQLDQSFQNESVGYVPDFFAVAIIGENPDVFDLQMPALSSFAVGSNGK